MDSTQVTERQAADLAARIGPMAGYLARLFDRMQKRGWAGGDVLYEDVKRSQEALHRLHVTLHELARLQRSAQASERRPWEPGGSGRST
jgi:hypothetical protein